LSKLVTGSGAPSYIFELCAGAFFACANLMESFLLYTRYLLLACFISSN
jgi:hypothetical protein